MRSKPPSPPLHVGGVLLPEGPVSAERVLVLVVLVLLVVWLATRLT